MRNLRKRKKGTARPRRPPVRRSAKPIPAPAVTMEVVHGPVSVQDLLAMIRVAAGRAQVVSSQGPVEDAPVVLLRTPRKKPVVLTGRQSQVVTLLLRGRTIRQIARSLKTNAASTERHLRVIIGKLAPALALPEPGRAGRRQ